MPTATPEKPPAPTASASATVPTNTASSTDRERYLHHAAVAGLVICPAIILLPPRKFDLYTVGLLTGTLVSANHLTYHYSGRSFATRWSDRFNSVVATDTLPPKAIIMQERLRREREERDRKLQDQLKIAKLGGNDAGPLVKEIETKLQEGKEKSILQKMWYGQEGEDWKQKRDEREKKALAEGRGYGDLIMDQIWEVWNWGQTSEKEKGGDWKEKEDGKK